MQNNLRRCRQKPPQSVPTGMHCIVLVIKIMNLTNYIHSYIFDDINDIIKYNGNSRGL